MDINNKETYHQTTFAKYVLNKDETNLNIIAAAIGIIIFGFSILILIR